ncbi:MAG TPA: TIGR04290 family methyltransferase, partial [Planctomycetota bacterium]|nr:TIGR04290 family methyltransferase [Planctomycetota bacterium]
YPLLALDIVSTIVRRKLVFQTLTLPEDEIVSAPQNLGFDEREAMLEAGWPRMAFVERRLAGDPTNWWVPNRALVDAVLRSAGLEITARPGTELYVCRPDAARTPEDRYFDDAQFRAACGKRR